MSRIQQMMESLQKRLDEKPNNTAGITATVQFIITGDEGGNWYVVCNDGKARVAEGESPDASTVLTLGPADYADVESGKLNAAIGFFTGKIKYSKDPSYWGLKVAKLFE